MWFPALFIFLFLFSGSNTSYLSAIDLPTAIGITIAASFVLFCCLGVLMAMCFCCNLRRKSKMALHQASAQPSINVYDVIGIDQKSMATTFALEMKTAL